MAQSLAAAANGERRRLLTQALEILSELRLMNHRLPIVDAYQAVHPTGKADAVRDLGGTLTKLLDQGAKTTAANSRKAFRAVNYDNLEDLVPVAVTANIDARGTRWSLGRWATTQCDTLGRHASSRGVTDEVGPGGKITIDVGDCDLCHSLFDDVTTIGGGALPPGHPGCTCTVSAA